MRQFTLLCILILSTYISSQSKILEEHQQILKKAAITSENVNQLLIEAVVRNVDTGLRLDKYVDVQVNLLKDYGKLMYLESPDSIIWRYCPINPDSSSWEYIRRCLISMDLKDLYYGSHLTVFDSTTGKKHIGGKTYYSTGKLFNSDSDEYGISVHSSHVGEWGGSILLAWQHKDEGMVLNGVSSFVPFHNFGRASILNICSLNEEEWLVVGDVSGGDMGMYRILWAVLWRFPYQVDVLYSIPLISSWPGQPVLRRGFELNDDLVLTYLKDTRSYVEDEQREDSVDEGISIQVDLKQIIAGVKSGKDIKDVHRELGYLNDSDLAPADKE